MIAFAEIEKRAVERKGNLVPLLHNPLSAKAIAAIPDDRWLSQMTRCIFEAGFNWDLIDKRWPQFETAFEGFDITRWVFMSDDDLDHLLKAPGLVANAQKIRSVGENARFISDIGKTHGSAGAWFADWPAERYMELCLELKTRGSRLGGITGQRMMRRMGVDALILTPTVLKALNHWSVIEGEPTSKKAFLGLQTILDDWRAETGHGLNHISQILAWSID
ncbi:DNA-3-methyladenine glycosylase I [Asticcacaulis taihuensis]|uniref:DNA-3-methyladenine glycosylase I n=1 Tax=Asticcacaulis taihuensis TaxID=260084 RepID=UPI003F7C4FD8